MKNPTNLTEPFARYYRPEKALLIYRETDPSPNDFEHRQPGIYVESYDIAPGGRPINAHPLSGKEMTDLATLLGSAEEFRADFLRSRGLMPKTILALGFRGALPFAIWYSPARKVHLSFVHGLDIPSGQAFLPPLIWKATKETLQIYAYIDKGPPKLSTTLYHAPFFNVGGNGSVCMGNVDTQSSPATHLEEFTANWENYFFGSYFTHTLAGGGGLKNTSIVQLWRKQVECGTPFPTETLKKTATTLKNIMQ